MVGALALLLQYAVAFNFLCASLIFFIYQYAEHLVRPAQPVADEMDVDHNFVAGEHDLNCKLIFTLGCLRKMVYGGISPEVLLR